jgi:hypothetical protein
MVGIGHSDAMHHELLLFAAFFPRVGAEKLSFNSQAKKPEDVLHPFFKTTASGMV